MYQYFEAEEQAQKLQQIFIHRIMKQMALRKWAKNAKLKQTKEEYVNKNQINFKIDDDESKDEVKTGDMRISEFGDERKNEDKKEKMNKDSQRKPVVNLKFGDIIYLKSYSESSQKGIISGDGIASNKLECLPQKLYDTSQKVQQKKIDDEVESNKSFSQKNDYLDSVSKMLKQTNTTEVSIFKRCAEQLFRKCLFRVVNEQKYFYQEKQQKSKSQQIPDSEQFNSKVLEEKKENQSTYDRLKGSNICYGQVIQLVHLYSDCTMTLNPSVLAQQNCCREVIKIRIIHFSAYYNTLTEQEI